MFEVLLAEGSGVVMSVIDSDLLDVSGLDGERLEAKICALAGRRAAEECAWLVLIGEFDRRERFDGWGCRSTAHWLNWQCGLSMPAARERVRVARALEQLPRLAEVFAAGRVTYSKVRAVTRVATAAIEEMLVELAVAATASQLDRICTAYRRVRRYEDDRARLRSAADEEEAHAAARAALESLSSGHDDDGMTVLRAVVVPEDGALIDAALASAVEHLSGAAGSSSAPAGAPDASEPPVRPSRVEALVELARSYLAANTVAPKIERRHLVMVVDVGEVTEHGELGIDGDGRCTLNGQRITPDTARRIGLSGPVTTILTDHHGLPLSVGRTSRYATTAQRLALMVRDGNGCRWPGCPSQYIDAHHIIEWDDGGLTDLLNLLQLCSFHHHKVHTDHITITLDPTTAHVEFRRPDGTLVTTRTADPADAPPHIDVADDTVAPGEAGTHLELHDITENLAHRDDNADTDDEADDRAA